MAKPTTLRKTPEDEAKLEQLRRTFPGVPDATLWRWGLDALLAKFFVAPPSDPSPQTTKAGPHPAKGTARKPKHL